MYEFSRVTTDAQRLAAYEALLRDVFPHARALTREYLAWQYRDNPRGTVVGFDAWAGDVLAAHYVTIPVEYTIHGRAARGLLSLNTATRQEHQGRGLFTRLAEQTYALAGELGYEFVIGVANQNSTPGFVRKLGFDLITPLDARIGMGAVDLTVPSEAALEPLWTAESLRWRLANPSARYRRRGRQVLAPAGRTGVRAVLTGRHAAPAGLSASGRLPAATLWIGLDARARFRGLFADVPMRLRPSPLNLILRDLGGSLGEIRRDDVRFELIDFDAY